LKKGKEKGNSLRDLFYENADLLNQAFQTMMEAVNAYCQNNIEEARLKAQATIYIEKKQDRSREIIIERIFSKETMVFTRSDRLKIIEKMDKVVDETEIVVRKLLQFNPTPPTELIEGLVKMSENIGKIGIDLKKLIKVILVDFSEGPLYIKNINDFRREVRDIHWILLTKIFELNLKPLEFNYFQNLIKAISKVSDKSEEFADEINGMLCKYAL
jgi:predicted phosphate transport protein (TIGR00153 family)